MSESSSSWFGNFGLLSNISSSVLQATSKVSDVIQRSIQPLTSNENQEQTSETVGKNKDLTSIVLFYEEFKWFIFFNLAILTDFSSTVLKSAQQLKQVVEEKSMIGNFTKEQDKFLTEKRIQQRREEAAVPPWVGYKEEDEMKEQILALSQVS